MSVLPQHKTDAIFREIFSNILAHRDYSSGYVAKFVIEKDRLYTENANRSHGHGALHLSSFEPYVKIHLFQKYLEKSVWLMNWVLA